MSDPVALIVASLEVILIFAGLVLLWRVGLSPAARAARLPPRLPAWDTPLTVFFYFVFVVICSLVATGVAAGLLLKRLPLAGDAVTVFNGAAGQIGLLLGVAAFHFRIERLRDTPDRTAPGIFASGIVTFLVTLPVLVTASLAWEFFLKLCGLPAEQQDLIRMFAHADSPRLLTAMIALAVILAPVVEELVFRAGFFRYFRTRMPRGVALLAPAIFFAMLHVDWTTLNGFASFVPLVVLAVMFSLAYERTGRIGTSMVAHALFNLNTIVLIFSGVGI